jgi:putative effector of murein hydrolase
MTTILMILVSTIIVYAFKMFFEGKNQEDGAPTMGPNCVGLFLIVAFLLLGGILFGKCGDSSEKPTSVYSEKYKAPDSGCVRITCNRNE